MSSRHARRISTPLPYYGKLTLSAGAITDVTRLAGVQGDGAAYPDSSVGVWPAATNYVKNSQAVTNTTGWAVNGTGADTPARSTAQAKFGSTSLLIGGTGVAATQGATYSGTDAGSAAVGETWTAVVWAYVVSGTVELGIYLSERDAGGGNLVTSASGGTNVSQGWTKITYTYTLVDASVSKIYPKIVTISNPGAAWQAYIQVNLFKSAIALPYIETDGGTASRSAGSITVPSAGVLSATQGWVFVRAKLGFANSYIGADDPRFFWWGVNDSRICLQPSSTGVQLISDTGPNDAIEQALTYASGDYVSVLGAWTSGFAYVSRNGSALTSVARTAVPTIAQTTFGLGSDPITGSRTLRGSILWAAAGLGTLTDADSALFHAWGNNDPLPHMFPRSAQLTFLAGFNGDGTMYRYAI